MRSRPKYGALWCWESSCDKVIKWTVLNHKAEVGVIKTVREDVEFEIREQRVYVLHGFELLKPVVVDVDHIALESPEIVAVKARTAKGRFAIADILDQCCT